MGYKRPSQKTHLNVGVLFSLSIDESYVWPFLRSFIEAFNEAITSLGYHMYLIPYKRGEGHKALLAKMETANISGLITLHLAEQELLDQLNRLNIPFVVIMDNRYQQKYASVCNDDFQGAYDAGKYLLSMGHKVIGYIGMIHPETPLMGSDRHHGVQKAFTEAGLVLDDEHCVGVDNFNDKNEIKEKIHTLLNLPNPPTALFCLHDYLAERILNVLELNGIHVPDDISMIAIGDTLDYGAIGVPQITTMRSETAQMGDLAADFLHKMITSPKPKQTLGIKLNQTLIERDSCIQQ